MCDINALTWIKKEDQYSPSLVLWRGDEPVTPRVAIYQGDAGYTLLAGHTQTFKRLHKAMRAGEAYLIDKDAFDSYGNDFDEDVELPVDCEVHLEPITPCTLTDEQRRDFLRFVQGDAEWPTPPWTPSEETETLEEEPEVSRIVKIHIEIADEPTPITEWSSLEEVSGDEYARLPEEETRVQGPTGTDEVVQFDSEQTNDGLQVIDPEDDEPECPCFTDAYNEGYDDGFDDGIDQAYDDARANAKEDLDQELALECDKAYNEGYDDGFDDDIDQDKKANILIGFSIGLGSAAIASLLAVLLHFVSWA